MSLVLFACRLKDALMARKLLRDTHLLPNGRVDGHEFPKGISSQIYRALGTMVQGGLQFSIANLALLNLGKFRNERLAVRISCSITMCSTL